MERLTPAQKELYDWLVEYINSSHHAPSIRQMMVAMNLRSPAPIQSRLERLRNKGYIDWTNGKARTIKILHQPEQGLPILGVISAGGLVEPFIEAEEEFDLSYILENSDYYILRVTGDSMIDDSIIEGDLVVMREVSSIHEAQNNDIVAARIPGQGTTLKRFYRNGNKVTLQPANTKYEPIEVDVDALELQGILVGIWRSIKTNR